MTFLNYARDYMTDICSDLCETIQTSSESLVQNVKTWVNTGSPQHDPEREDTDGVSVSGCNGGGTYGRNMVVGGYTPDIRQYRRRDIDFVINSKHRTPVKSVEKPKDEIRRANEVLCTECAKAQEEYKRLKGVVEQLDREYEDSKEVDVFRRYGMLKGMIKRSVLHLKLGNEETTQVQVSAGKQKEETRKREERLIGLNTQDIMEENETLNEQIKQYKRKITMTKDLIHNLDLSYEASKRYIAIQRYRLMKSMIKTVINNKWIKD